MTEFTSLLPIASSEIADFSIAFAKLSIHGNEENAEPAGSGTLVSIGPIHGILTAAHVLRKLPDSGKVGLIRFTPSPKIQKQTIDMSYTEKLVIGGNHENDDQPRSPDIGFLRLAPDQVGSLNATNIFFNLSKRAQAVLGDKHPSDEYFEGLSGVIAEWTIDGLPGEAGFDRVKGFRGLFGVGLVAGSTERKGYDLVDFQVTFDESSGVPLSYGGMSGGALWRVYVKKDCNEQISILDKRIFGIAFHQSKLVDGNRSITCHGTKTVYSTLVGEIQSRWPAA